LRIDANDPASVRSTLRPNDIMLDAAGPFHGRTLALVESAIEIGFDVIDINDDLSYAERVHVLKPRIDAAGIRVLSSASTVSAVAAAAILQSGIADPARVSAFLAPATRHTANAGAARSLIRSIGRPIRIFRDGKLEQTTGWSERCSFEAPSPIGRIDGRSFESADAFYLPRIWPSLRDVAMYVDTNTPGVNFLLDIAAKSRFIRERMASQVRASTAVARLFGSSAGGIGYEIADGHGNAFRFAIVARENSFIAAVAPAVLAVRAILNGEFEHRGLVLPHQHVEHQSLVAYLQAEGISCSQIP